MRFLARWFMALLMALTKHKRVFIMRVFVLRFPRDTTRQGTWAYPIKRKYLFCLFAHQNSGTCYSSLPRSPTYSEISSKPTLCTEKSSDNWIAACELSVLRFKRRALRPRSLPLTTRSRAPSCFGITVSTCPWSASSLSPESRRTLQSDGVRTSVTSPFFKVLPASTKKSRVPQQLPSNYFPLLPCVRAKCFALDSG